MVFIYQFTIFMKKYSLITIFYRIYQFYQFWVHVFLFFFYHFHENIKQYV